jgi:hypothetical protein
MQSSAHAQTVMLPDHGTAGERPEPDDLRRAFASAERDRVVVDAVLSLLAADKPGRLAAVSEAMQAVARRWRELAL